MEIENIENKKLDIQSYRAHLAPPSAILTKIQRQNFAVNLRKEKRINIFSKSRGIKSNKDSLLLKNLPECFDVHEHLTDIEKLLHIKAFFVENNPLMYQALMFLKQELENNQESLIGVLVNLGYIEILGGYLNFNQTEEIIRLSSHIICNISAGAHEYILRIAENGLIDKLIVLINKNYPKAAENSI